MSHGFSCLLPVLLLSATAQEPVLPKSFSRPVELIESPSPHGQREFIADAGGQSIRIHAGGWSFLDRAGKYGSGMRFDGMSLSPVFDTSTPAGTFSYFVGRDPQRWIRGARTYARVREIDIYPGVDVVYYGHDGTLEHDFVVRPHADFRHLSMLWTGPGKPRLDLDGSLVLPAESGALRLSPPAAYQMSGQVRVAVPCRYDLRGDTVHFQVGHYDRSRVLVIDPQLLFAHLLQGYYPAIATDRVGNSYTACSFGRPATPGAYQPVSEPSLADPYSASITKRDSRGNVVWTAVIGLNISLAHLTVAVDGSGNVYVAGPAGTSGFPVTPGAFPATPPHQYGFLSKLSADGTRLLYSTLLAPPVFGGYGTDQVTALAVSENGEMTFAGTLLVPQDGGYSARRPGSLVARISADGTKVLYSRMLLGTVFTLALDAGGNSVFGGRGCSVDPAPISLHATCADSTFYVSPDGGATVQSYSSQPETTGLAIDAENPLSLLRSTSAGVFQSSDGGTTWKQVDSLGTGSYYAVWIHPRKPQLRFAVSNVVLRSEDGGETWQSTQGLSPTEAVFFHEGFFDAGGSHILSSVNTFTAPLLSTDDGKTWQPLISIQYLGFTVCCALDPADLQHFLVGTQTSIVDQSAIAETHDGGASFQFIDAFNPDVPVVFDPGSPGVVYGYRYSSRDYAQVLGYLISNLALVKSEDGGHTWRLPKSGAHVPANQIVVDPSGSGRLYTFGPFGVYRSVDRGETWSHLSGPLGNTTVFSGSVTFGDADRLYGLAAVLGDGYVTKLDPSGAPVFSTLIGGRNIDNVQSVAIASNGDVLIGGTTQSDDFLASSGVSVRTNGAFEQGFLARLTSNGSALLGFRYIGGSTTDSISSIALLSSGEVAIAGASASPDQPDVTSDAFAPRCCGGFLGVYSADSFIPRFFSFLGRFSLSGVATAGMLAYFAGPTDISQSIGVPVVCEAASTQDCLGLLTAVDFGLGHPRGRR